jgi:hypothetical protein
MSMVISTRRVIHFQSSIQEAAEFSDSFSQWSRSSFSAESQNLKEIKLSI